MGDFFSLIYRLNLYGEQLYYHLHGWDDATNSFIAANDRFPAIFLYTIGFAVLTMVMFYFIVNHPRQNKLLHWLISLAVTALFGYLFGYNIVAYDIYNSNIATSLAPYISSSNAIMFGVYNAVICMLWFFIFSVIFRRWSRNCKHIPFKLISTSKSK